ncbi:unnamed protein product [Arabidopsis arenosa]|uniref:Uncharacterized protein n=1 Tax=Arabidopsis arenosa TaxID=38785 RepID=A0A8S2ABY4_ARAAE|nr:unnamed protein product [Arabidopsis arenosa]
MSDEQFLDFTKTKPNLNLPVAFEELNHEAFRSLHPDQFSGLRVNYSAAIYDQKVFISSTNSEANNECGGYFFHPKLVLVGKASTDGTLNARVKASVTEQILLKASATSSTALVTLEYTGLSNRSQLQLGSNGLMGATYIQRVSPRLSLGSEFVWAGVSQKSAVGFGVATAQGFDTGNILMTYVHKVSKKVSLATEFVFNYLANDAKASFGCDYVFDQCRLRGNADSEGAVCALIEGGLGTGKISLSAKLADLKKGDVVFGLGIALDVQDGGVHYPISSNLDNIRRMVKFNDSNHKLLSAPM